MHSVSVIDSDKKVITEKRQKIPPKKYEKNENMIKEKGKISPKNKKLKNKQNKK